MRKISRNKYARQTLVSRRVVVDSQQVCAWCGSVGTNKRRDGTINSRYLIQYGMEHDGFASADYWRKELFCCIDCMRAYQGD